MVRNLLSWTAAATLVLASVVPASSATVEDVQGAVFISRGEGYLRTASGVTVVAGNRVMAPLGSSAALVYSESCRVPVPGGSVVTVDPETACVPSSQGQQAGNGAGAAGGGVDTTLLVGGGLAGAAAIGLAAALSGGSDNNPTPRPISP